MSVSPYCVGQLIFTQLPLPFSLLKTLFSRQTLFQELEHRTIGYRTVLEALLTQLLVLIVRDLEVAEHPEPSAEFSLTDRNYLMIEESFLYEYRDLTLEKLLQTGLLKGLKTSQGRISG